MLTPGDPRVMDQVGRSAASALSMQPYRHATHERVGLP
jgi:hypothetical protein